MHDKKHGLGKGMSSLISDFDYDAQIANVVNKTIGEKKEEENKEETKKADIPAVHSDQVIKVKLDDISPNPNQPRKNFDDEALSSLALSIKSEGIIQPLIVEEVSPGKYQIIEGERRYRAARLASLNEVPAIVRNIGEIAKMEIALIENIQRENLNPIEEAYAYQALITRTGYSQEEIAKRVGKSRSLVANTLRLLGLSDALKDDVISGVISAGHARAILSLKNPADQILLRNRIIEKNLSVRDAEELANEYNRGHKVVQRNRRGSDKDDMVLDAEAKFSSAIGAHTELKGSLERGKLEIRFRSQKELERIYAALSDGEELFEE